MSSAPSMSSSGSPSMKLAVVDIETTGAAREGHKITEIAILCVDDGVVVEEWSSLINPERFIPWGITKLTGITDEMVAEAPKFFSVAKKIIELTEGRIFVAHNAFFDYRFIQSEFSDLGYTFQREVMCTVRLARKGFPGLPSYSLHNLSKHFALKRESEHRALDDARACYEVFRRVYAASPDAIATSEQKPLPPGLEDFALDKLPSTPGTYFFYTRQNLLLYVGKARSIRERVRQHFQSVGDKKRQAEMKEHIARIEYKEWGSDELASLMELQFIKDLRPLMNRASRKINYRYTLTLHPEAPAGEELRVSTSIDSEWPRFGSRARAQEERAKIYQAAFGVEADGLFFQQEMSKWHIILGREKVQERLQAKLLADELVLTDGAIELPGRRRDERAFIKIEDGRLKEVQLVDSQGEVEIYPLEDYPDMRRLVARFSR